MLSKDNSVIFDSKKVEELRYQKDSFMKNLRDYRFINKQQKQVKYKNIS